MCLLLMFVGGCGDAISQEYICFWYSWCTFVRW